MRYSDITNEALNVFKVHGDRDNAGSYRAGDLKATKNQVWNERIKSYFSRTPYEFNIHLWNKTENAKRPTILPKAGQITFAMSHNEGDERVGLTPWILAHRLVHGIFEGAVDTKDFISEAVFLIDVLGNKNSAYRFKSGKNGVSMLRTGELVIDMLTQYIVQGSITFDFDPENAMMQTEFVQRAVREVNARAKELLDRAVGKVFYLGAEITPQNIASIHRFTNKSINDRVMMGIMKCKNVEDARALIDDIIAEYTDKVEFPAKRLDNMKRDLLSLALGYFHRLNKPTAKDEKPAIAVTEENISILDEFEVPSFDTSMGIVSWVKSLDDAARKRANDAYTTIRAKYEPKFGKDDLFGIYAEQHRAAYTTVSRPSAPVKMYLPKKFVLSNKDAVAKKIIAYAKRVSSDGEYGYYMPEVVQKLAASGNEKLIKMARDSNVVAIRFDNSSVSVLLPQYSRKSIPTNKFGYNDFEALLKAREERK